MSYVERTLYWFLKNKVFGGIKKLKEKEYLPFTILILGFAAINTAATVLLQFNIIFSLELVQKMLILQLFVSYGLIVAGFFVGHFKRLTPYFIVTILIIAAFTLLPIIFNFNYDQNLVQYSKLTFFLIWVFISCVSFFFLMLYFFTSFPKKVIMLGAPKEHIFFEPIIKIVVYISIPVYAYIMLQISPASLIIGGFGILVAIVILIIFRKAPKKIEKYPGTVNFVSAIGFFYIYLFYHLIASFSVTSNNLSSIIMDDLLLFIITLYLVQSLTRRISESPEQIQPDESPIRFQTRLYFTDRLKKVLGERGVVLIVMGLVLGYQMAYLDSLFVTQFPILSNFFTPELRLSALYHRIYLIFAFFVIIIAILVFYSSDKFRDLMVDKYTVKQVFKYIGAFFQRPEDGTLSPLELGVQFVADKVGETIKNVGEKWQKAFKEKTTKFLKDRDQRLEDRSDDKQPPEDKQ